MGIDLLQIGDIAAQKLDNCRGEYKTGEHSKEACNAYEKKK